MNRSFLCTPNNMKLSFIFTGRNAIPALFYSVGFVGSGACLLPHSLLNQNLKKAEMLIPVKNKSSAHPPKVTQKIRHRIDTAVRMRYFYPFEKKQAI